MALSTENSGSCRVGSFCFFAETPKIYQLQYRERSDRMLKDYQLQYRERSDRMLKDLTAKLRLASGRFAPGTVKITANRNRV